MTAAANERSRRRAFFDELRAGFAALRADPKAWAEEQRERALWDMTNTDAPLGH